MLSKKTKTDTQCTMSALKKEQDTSLLSQPYLKGKGAEQPAHGCDARRRDRAGLGKAGTLQGSTMSLPFCVSPFVASGSAQLHTTPPSFISLIVFLFSPET